MKKIAKAKAGKSFGMLSVKAGIDKNPKPTAADRIAGAKMKAVGKAKNGAKIAAKKVVAKKPIKKAQDGTKMVVDGKEYKEGSMLPEAVVTGKPIKSLKDRVKSVKDKVESIGDGLGLNRSYKPKPAKRSVLSVKTYRQKGSGPGSGLMKLKQRITRRYQDGGNLVEGTTLPEAVVTASRIKDKPSKSAKPQKNYTRDLIKRANKMNRNQAGYSRMNPRRYEEGGDVSMAKKGASVKKAVGKCKMGC